MGLPPPLRAEGAWGRVAAAGGALRALEGARTDGALPWAAPADGRVDGVSVLVAGPLLTEGAGVRADAPLEPRTRSLGREETWGWSPPALGAG